MWHKNVICIIILLHYYALKTIFSANHRTGYIVSRMLISLIMLMSVCTTNIRV